MEAGTSGSSLYPRSRKYRFVRFPILSPMEDKILLFMYSDIRSVKLLKDSGSSDILCHSRYSVASPVRLPKFSGSV